MYLREVIYKFTFPEYYPIVREEMEIFSFFGILFLIEIIISDSNYMVITTIDCTRGNGNVLIFRNYISDRNDNFRQ